MSTVDAIVDNVDRADINLGEMMKRSFEEQSHQLGGSRLLGNTMRLKQGLPVCLAQKSNIMCISHALTQFRARRIPEHNRERPTKPVSESYLMLHEASLTIAAKRSPITGRELPAKLISSARFQL
jgi:hypothetical protein